MRGKSVTEGHTGRCVNWAALSWLWERSENEEIWLEKQGGCDCDKEQPQLWLHCAVQDERVPWCSKAPLKQEWCSCLYQLHTWLPHVDLLFSKLICTKCFSTVTVRIDKMSCGSHNSDSSQPLGMMSQWFLQHCPQPNGPELCIDASRNCAESCTWGTGTHMLSLDHAPSLCVRTALIFCLVPPHSYR